VLETQGSSKPTQCALICTPGSNGACPTGATCQAIQGEGICTYPSSTIEAMVTTMSHYGARVAHETETPVGVTKSWKLVRPSAPTDVVTAQIFLAHDEAQIAALEREWTERSDPIHAKYAQWFSAAELAERFAPPTAALELVTEWLAAEGVAANAVDVALTKDIVSVSVPAPLAARLFGARFSVYATPSAPSRTIHRIATPYSLPARVAEAVSMVGSIARFPAPTGVIRTASAESETEVPATWPAGCGAVCKNYVTPAVLTEAYSLGDAVAEGAALGSMAVAEFQSVYYDEMDFYYFKNACKLPFNVSVDKQIGANSPKECKTSMGLDQCLEALLDIQFIKGVAGGIPLSDVYSSDYSLPGWVAGLQKLTDADLPLINRCARRKRFVLEPRAEQFRITPPQRSCSRAAASSHCDRSPPRPSHFTRANVRSVSYGNDEKQQTSRTFMYTTNTAFMKIGLRGVSILFASGDQGVWGRSGPGRRFHPDFPASSPYITAVGGTDFATKGACSDRCILPQRVICTAVLTQRLSVPPSLTPFHEYEQTSLARRRLGSAAAVASPQRSRSRRGRRTPWRATRRTARRRRDGLPRRSTTTRGAGASLELRRSLPALGAPSFSLRFYFDRFTDAILSPTYVVGNEPLPSSQVPGRRSARWPGEQLLRRGRWQGQVRRRRGHERVVPCCRRRLRQAERNPSRGEETAAWAAEPVDLQPERDRL
jgi:hypothetical protein